LDREFFVASMWHAALERADPWFFTRPRWTTEAIAPAADQTCGDGRLDGQALTQEARLQEVCAKYVLADWPDGAALLSNKACIRRRALAICEQRLGELKERSQVALADSRVLELPGMPVKFHVSDLGVIGQSGVLLLLTWGYYAFRRENHAIKQFVRLRPARPIHWTNRMVRCPREYTLQAVDKHLSAEHLVYAYKAVSQRFVFMLSQPSPPLRAMTMLLVALPFVVSVANVVSDFLTLKDLLEPFEKYEAGLLHARFRVSAALLVPVALVTVASWRCFTNSGWLLNGWYLASATVWNDEWDERTTLPASEVAVDARAQIAVRQGAIAVSSSKFIEAV
jgi:hypothetical protein